ncbi:MAG: exo-alpha-sialidase [Thermomicrobiales bacterium]|nr:exo-alpha-sialidase [Thermomicrobiales bacterium]
MEIVDAGLIFDAEAADSSGRSNAFTSLTRLSDGSYRAAFRSAPGRDIAGGRLRIMGSDDGRVWSTIHPGLTRSIDDIEGDMYAGYFTESEPGALLGAFVWVDRSNPDLSFVHPQTAGILPTRNLLATSHDGGATWFDWWEVDLGPEQGCTVTGPVFAWGDGTLALPYETWKFYEDASPGSHTASLRLSPDRGRSWIDRKIVAADPESRLFYWDQRMAVDPGSGEAVAMFWTHDRQEGQDVENHIAWSSGPGMSWSTPQPAGWRGQHCQPLWLDDSRLLAVYVERDSPGGIALRLSPDFGRTWPGDDYLRVYDHAATATRSSDGFEAFWQEMMTWQFGHPRAVLNPDGTILIAWYAGHADATSVHWARVAARSSTA